MPAIFDIPDLIELATYFAVPGSAGSNGFSDILIGGKGLGLTRRFAGSASTWLTTAYPRRERCPISAAQFSGFQGQENHDERGSNQHCNFSLQYCRPLTLGFGVGGTAVV